MTYMGEERRSNTDGTDALRKVETTDRWVKRLAVALLALFALLGAATFIVVLVLLGNVRELARQGAASADQSRQAAVVNGEVLRRLEAFERAQVADRDARAARSQALVRDALAQISAEIAESDRTNQLLLQQVLDVVTAELRDPRNQEHRGRPVLRPAPRPQDPPAPRRQGPRRPPSSSSPSPQPSPQPEPCLLRDPVTGRCIVRPGAR